MTVREYNDWYKKANNAISFVCCIDHALIKCDENSIKQFMAIGWSEDIKEFLCDAVECYRKEQKEKLKKEN